MKNGCLFDFIYFPQEVLNEDLTKILFYKIFQGIKKCKECNICIRDIKLENILLDDNYNPILCDFGFGEISENEIEGKFGTHQYIAPEILLDKPYDGFKVDIFNLAIALYILMTGKPFITLEDEKTGKELFGDAYDDRAKLLYDREYERFWNRLGALKNNFSEDLKQLFKEMTYKEPSERLTIDQILEHKWLSGLNDEKIKELEKKLKKEFDKRQDKVSTKKKILKEYENYKASSLLDENRGLSEECEQYFSRDLRIKSIDKDSIRENYVEIKDKTNNFDPYDFMNNLYDDIIKNFENNYTCEKEEKKSLKFNFILNDEDDDENIFKKYLNIEVKMFKTDDGYLLRFRKKKGELYDYYENIKKIISVVDKFC
jgi:serine/threonine protein kinase